MNELTIILVTILFPGVLFTVIYDNYTEHRPWDAFRYTLYSIASGIITYSVLQFLVFFCQLVYNIENSDNTVFYVLSVWDVLKTSKFESINPIEIISAGFLSVALGLFAVKITQENTIHKILIKLKITNKYGDSSTYSQTIDHIKDYYVRLVVLDENMTFYGTISLYHDDGVIQELTLEDLTAYETSSGEVIFKADILYISKPFGKLMFYTPKHED